MKKFIALLLALTTAFTMTVPAFADDAATPSDPIIEVIPEEELTEKQKLFIERIISGEIDSYSFNPYGDYEEPIEIATVQLVNSLGFLVMSPIALASPLIFFIFPPIGVAAAILPIAGLGLTLVYSANLIFVAPVKELIWLSDNGYI